MASTKRGTRISSMRGLLLWWIIGSGIVIVIVYSSLLEYYFEYGVVVRTKTVFQHYAEDFAARYKTDPNVEFPISSGLQSYRSLEEIPLALTQLFPNASYEHNEFQMFIDEEYDEKSREQLYCANMPCEVVFFYSYQLNDRDWLYLSQGIVGTDEIVAEFELSELILNAIAFAILILFGALAYFLFNRISQPVQQLAAWTDKLTSVHQTEDIPDFRFQELNQVADRLSDAFERIAESLEKEHRFLKYASHELRTPIAVASGNLEILEKLAALRDDDRSENDNEEERLSLDRLNYAIREMQQLTETLLWLNRDVKDAPPEESVDLRALTLRLVDNNQYLLDCKSVNITVNGPETQVHVPLALCQILLANLIRNAFQHTLEGNVTITLSGLSVTICNQSRELSTQDSELDPIQEYGFGLGLELVEQIADRLGWSYSYEVHENGRTSTVSFTQSLTN